MAQTVVEQLVVELRARTDQAETRLREVENQLGRTAKKGKEAGAAAGDLGGKYAGAAQQVASAAENMARSGQVSGDAAKQMIQQGAGMAMMFGAAGPIVGAVAIAGLAIFELFDRARKEMEETRRKADDELRQMARNRDVGGLARRATELYSGNEFIDPESAKDEDERRRLQAQKLGILGMRAEVKKLEEKAERGVVGNRSFSRKEARDLYDEIQAWNRDIREYERQNAEAQRRLFGAGPGAGVVKRGLDEEQNRFKIDSDQKAADAAKNASKKAATDAERELAQALARTEKAVTAWQTGLAGGMRTVQDAVLAGTATLLDDMRASISATEAELTQLGVPPTFLAQWKNVAEAGYRTQAAAELTAAAFQEIGAPKTIDGLAAGVSRLQGLEQVLVVARDKEAKGSVARAEIEKQLATTTEKRLQLTQKLGRATLGLTVPSKEDADAAERAAKAREEAARHAAELATEIAMVARGALAAADAFGAMSESTRTTLTDVVNLAEGVGRIIAKPGDIGAWVQSVGSVLNLGAGAFGLSARDREEKANRQANAEVVASLRELSGALDDAVAQLQGMVTDTFLGVQKGVDAIVQQTQGVSGKKNLLDVDKAFTPFGVSLADAQAAAEALGITLDGTVDSYRLLGEALATARAELTEFGSSFADRRAENDLAVKAYGIEMSPNQAVLQQIGMGGAGALREQLLSGFGGGVAATDLTPEGLAKLRVNAQGIFEQLRQGGDAVDPALLAGTGMTPEEFRQYLSNYFDALASAEDDIQRIADSAAEKAHTARQTAIAAALAEDDLYDRDDPGERFATTTKAYAEQIPVLERLTDGLDLATSEGLARFDERVREFYEGVKDGSVVVEGFTADELINAIFNMETAGDAAAQAIAEATASLREYTRSLEDDLAVRELFADGNRAGGDRLSIEQQQKAELDEAIAKGVAPEVLARLQSVQKKELAAFDASLVASDDVGRGGGAGATSVVARASAASIDQLIGIANSGLALDRERNALLGSISRLLATGALPVITPPQILPHGASAGGGGTGGSGGITVSVLQQFYGPVSGMDEVRAATGLGAQDIAAELQRQLDTRRRVEGRAGVI